MNTPRRRTSSHPMLRVWLIGAMVSWCSAAGTTHAQSESQQVTSEPKAEHVEEMTTSTQSSEQLVPPKNAEENQAANDNPRSDISNTSKINGDQTQSELPPPFQPATKLSTPAKTTQAPPDNNASPISTTQRTPKNPKSFGLWVLLPPIIAIFMAIFTRQVVIALVVGLLVGTYMMLPCLPVGDAFAGMNSIVGGVRMAVERYILDTIVNPDHGFGKLKIIIFTLVIGFTVGVIGRNGGSAGMVRLVAGDTLSPRRGAITAWLAGLVVFFDDYANTMIVGPTMRPVFDKLKLSREKLAYIVDSTAAPVASLALIGTWVGAEIGYINDGIGAFGASAPTFLSNGQGGTINGMQAFISSLPYRFYPMLTLFLVFLLAWTGRDFGPMKRAQNRAANGIDEPSASTESSTTTVLQPGSSPRWWLGVVPIFILVSITIGIMISTGLGSENTMARIAELNVDGESVWNATPIWERASVIISNADSYLSIFYGAILSAVAAIILTTLARACSIRDAADAGLEGMARMFPAIVILVLAWALSEVTKNLMLGEVVAANLNSIKFPAHWLPLAVFIASAAVSFAMGSSWGTMGIMCPATISIAAVLLTDLPADKAISLFYASVGSVLAGSVFGDHCSPISDTTVLSSIASGCRHEDHVWTQLPYALICAIAAMGLGDVLCSAYDQPWYAGLGAGAVFLFLVVLIVGRKPAITAAEPKY